MTQTNITKGYMIGKAKTMYTLYSFVNDGVRINYAFEKIVSKDLSKVKALYPDLKIDESLHGKFVEKYCGPEATVHVEHNVNLGYVFKSGKYKGMKVDEVKDPSYLCFVYNNGYFTNINVAIKARAIELGAKEILGKIYVEGTPNYVAAMNLDNLITHNVPFRFTPKTGLSEYGVMKDFTLQYEITFGKIKWMNIIYGLPVDETGKGRRIRNKEIVVTKASIEAHEGYNNLLIIESFKMAKK